MTKPKAKTVVARPKFGLPRHRPPPMQVSKLEALTATVLSLDKALRDALERKPNQALQELVGAVRQCAYQMKAQRAELDQLAMELRANTTAVGQLLGHVPKVGAASQEAPLKPV